MEENIILDGKRHTLAHLLAYSVITLYPGAQNAIGPAIENGFYQDFDLGDHKISEEDLPKIESKMREVIKGWKEFQKREVSLSDVKKEFAWNAYKVELAEEFEAEGKNLTFYTAGDFVDLCRGGHTNNPSLDIDPESWKLSHIAGAYWRGDSKNKMLTRIYGLSFENKSGLEEYLFRQEESKKRDHRKLGKELDLFTFSEFVGSGLPLYTPKGALVRRLLNDFVEELQSKAGYTQVWTPQIAKGELFKISGHYDKYKDDMFRVVSNYSEEEFYLKPMNCPQHTQIYLSQKRSYRDLPLRYSDFSMLYRDERPGELNGLARVRSFSQDDCHIFCKEDQVDKEIDTALEMTKKVLGVFGFKYRYRLSIRDPKTSEKYLGNKDTWDRVEKWAEEIMKRHNIEYFIGEGEASFYAPKMDLMATDALGREWQLSTVQIDFVQPERFGLKYTDKDGVEKTPVMIHRAIVGSPERFMMVLIEHFSGNFPLWLSPIQIKICPVREEHNQYAEKILDSLKEKGIRAIIDNRDENLGKKVRSAKEERIPYWVVVGDKDIAENKLTLESRESGGLGQMNIDELAYKLLEEIVQRKM